MIAVVYTRSDNKASRAPQFFHRESRSAQRRRLALRRFSRLGTRCYTRVVAGSARDVGLLLKGGSRKR